MREIKFRVWDTHTKHMIDTGFHVLGEVMLCDAITGYAREHPIEDVNWLLRLNDFILMQYTGLKDKNGVDIYEGDIIKYHNIKAAVRFGDGQWHVFHGGGVYEELCGEAIRIYGMEVIGNIYENKELVG